MNGVSFFEIAYAIIGIGFWCYSQRRRRRRRNAIHIYTNLSGVHLLVYFHLVFLDLICLSFARSLIHSSFFLSCVLLWFCSHFNPRKVMKIHNSKRKIGSNATFQGISPTRRNNNINWIFVLCRLCFEIDAGNKIMFKNISRRKSANLFHTWIFNLTK